MTPHRCFRGSSSPVRSRLLCSMAPGGWSCVTSWVPPSVSFRVIVPSFESSGTGVPACHSCSPAMSWFEGTYLPLQTPRSFVGHLGQQILHYSCFCWWKRATARTLSWHEHPCRNLQKHIYVFVEFIDKLHSYSVTFFPYLSWCSNWLLKYDLKNKLHYYWKPFYSSLYVIIPFFAFCLFAIQI